MCSKLQRFSRHGAASHHKTKGHQCHSAPPRQSPSNLHFWHSACEAHFGDPLPATEHHRIKTCFRVQRHRFNIAATGRISSGFLTSSSSCRLVALCASSSRGDTVIQPPETKDLIQPVSSCGFSDFGMSRSPLSNYSMEMREASCLTLLENICPYSVMPAESVRAPPPPAM